MIRVRIALLAWAGCAVGRTLTTRHATTEQQLTMKQPHKQAIPFRFLLTSRPRRAHGTSAITTAAHAPFFLFLGRETFLAAIRI